MALAQLAQTCFRSVRSAVSSRIGIPAVQAACRHLSTTPPPDEDGEDMQLTPEEAFFDEIAEKFAEEQEENEEEVDDVIGEEEMESYIHASLLEDEPPQFTLNLAGPGQPAWHIIDCDEDIGATYYGYDLIGGAVPNNEQNALLSEDAKQLIFDLHKEDPDYWTIPRLAQVFKIRQQRVMAIIALIEMDNDRIALGDEPNRELSTHMHLDVWECIHSRGSGERYVRNLPTQPKFELVEPSTLGPNAKPGTAVSEIAAVEDIIGKQEDAMMIKEFKERLDYNMMRVGKSIQRESRKKHPLKRPKEGWSMVISPLGRGTRARKNKGEPYVAKPDGTKRELTDDERLYLQRMVPKPRRKMA